MSNPDLREALASLKIDRDAHAPRENGSARLWLGVGLAVLVLAAGLFWYLRPRPVPVRTAVVEAAGAAAGPTAVLNASGYVTARRQATVSSKVTGKVVEVLIEEGMRGRRGPGAGAARRLQTPAPRSASPRPSSPRPGPRSRRPGSAARGEARPATALPAWLDAPGGRSRADLDAARADLDSLEARLDAASAAVDVAVARRPVLCARQDLDDTVIRAPFAGIVVSKNAQPGEMISPMSAGGFTRTGISHRRRHVVARGRGRRQRGLHPRVVPGPAGRSDSRRLPRLDRSRPRHHHHPDRRPAEGDRPGARSASTRSTRGSCPTWVSRSPSWAPAEAAAAATRSVACRGRRFAATRGAGHRAAWWPATALERRAVTVGETRRRRRADGAGGPRCRRAGGGRRPAGARRTATRRSGTSCVMSDGRIGRAGAT